MNGRRDITAAKKLEAIEGFADNTGDQCLVTVLFSLTLLTSVNN